tara:strand:+ start:311 stop:439 length:129 start_codon:yes stop_codon:yes gene_type:complete
MNKKLILKKLNVLKEMSLKLDGDGILIIKIEEIENEINKTND